MGVYKDVLFKVSNMAECQGQVRSCQAGKEPGVVRTQGELGGWGGYGQGEVPELALGLLRKGLVEPEECCSGAGPARATRWHSQ